MATTRTTRETTATLVLEAVAARTGMDVYELPPLFDVCDPDALDSAIESMTAGHVSFPYAGLTVTVDSSGAVEVSDAIPVG